MKLLLDENISRRIAPILQDAFPGTTHVALQSVLGYPPKIICLALGNCNNQQVSDALILSRTEIETALSRPDTGLVELTPATPA